MKTFVINLPDRKDRMQRFNANNPYLEYETFKAVEGYKVGYEKLPVSYTHLTLPTR